MCALVTQYPSHRITRPSSTTTQKILNFTVAKCRGGGERGVRQQIGFVFGLKITIIATVAPRGVFFLPFYTRHRIKHAILFQVSLSTHSPKPFRHLLRDDQPNASPVKNYRKLTSVFIMSFVNLCSSFSSPSIPSICSKNSQAVSVLFFGEEKAQYTL